MPLSGRVYTFPELAGQTFHGLPGLLADSLPDKFGNAVIDAWLQRQGRTPSSFDPVERLCYTGSRGMGALEYVPARGPGSAESDRIEINRLVQLASDILQSREDMHVVIGEDAMQEIIRVGTSAGGARAKAVIAWNEQTGDMRSGQIDAGKGYVNLPGAYSYEQAAQVMRRLRISNTEIAQFYRRMVFNVLTRNQDDHVKNISFLMNRRGQWHLAPAYDMAYAYNPDGMWTGTHQMTVNGKRDAITRQDLLLSARNMGVKRAEAERIIYEVQKSRADWLRFAETAMLQETAAGKILRTFTDI